MLKKCLKWEDGLVLRINNNKAGCSHVLNESLNFSTTLLRILINF